jgi:hypothetical protein
MLHAARIEAEWLAIGAALLGSTVLSLVVTVLVFRAFARPDDGEERGDA